MNNQYKYKDKVIMRIGECIVHDDAGTREAHVLFKADNYFMTLPINTANELTGLKDEVFSQLLFDIYCSEVVTKEIIALFGPISKWATRRRTREFARARQIYFFAMRHSTSYSLEKITTMLPVKFHHATVIHGMKAIEAEIHCGQFDVIDPLYQIAEALELVGSKRLIKALKVISKHREQSKKLIQENREAIG